MDTLRLVDPEIRHIVAGFRAFDPATQSVEDFRALTLEIYAATAPETPVPFEERRIPGPDGADEVRLLIHRPTDACGDVGRNLPAIVYLHGGAMIAGNPDMMAPANRDLAQRTRAVVIAVQYRLAPENPFPGPVEDVVAALAWLFESAVQIGVDPTRVVLYGQSAGGGLAASAALLARDRGVGPLSGQVLLYPMLDPRTGTDEAATANPVTGQFVHTRAGNSFGWKAMRGSDPIPHDKLGYFAPALATDLVGLPSSFIATGSLDLFLDEDVAYGMALIRAGVRCELHVYEGAVHGFEALPSRNARAFAGDVQKAIKRMLCLTEASSR